MTNPIDGLIGNMARFIGRTRNFRNLMFLPYEAMAAALLAAGSAPSLASAAAFDQMVVFGDSLSDTGNAGRFSNGPVWVEQLASQLGLSLEPSERGGLNFAVGGARLDPSSGPDNLRAQTDLYLGSPRRAGRTLHIVFGGGNDLLAAVQAPGAERIVKAAAASLKSIMADLAKHGATDLFVPNLPDVGMTPAVHRLGQRAVAAARDLTNLFNNEVDKAVTVLASRHEVRFHRLDIRAMAERARADPGAFGFKDVTTPCNVLDSCEGYLFWDDVHPTTRAHGRLADAAIELVSGR
ncbi:MAG: SGNH/GDSL hydrolase family protein [Xanthobacteraceae bacterium]